MTTVAPLTPISALKEGKTKILSSVAGQPQWLQVLFKDRATAFNAQKEAWVEGKGALNAKLSAKLFSLLEQAGLPTCFLQTTAQPNVLIYQALSMIPVEVVVRNVALGSLCQRLPFYQQGQRLNRPVVEFFLKSDEAGDPPLPEDVIEEQGYLPAGVTLQQLKLKALQANELLCTLFEAQGIVCADFKLEFGVNAQGQLLLADELSPDNFRLRDAATGQILDKDVFRLEVGDLGETYAQLWQRLEHAQLPESLSLQGYQLVLSVAYKPNVLHPESRAVLSALESLGHHGVTQLHAGRRFELTLRATSLLAAEKQALLMCEQLLANPVIEAYRLESLKALSVL